MLRVTESPMCMHMMISFIVIWIYVMIRYQR